MNAVRIADQRAPEEVSSIAYAALSELVSVAVGVLFYWFVWGFSTEREVASGSLNQSSATDRGWACGAARKKADGVRPWGKLVRVAYVPCSNFDLDRAPATTLLDFGANLISETNQAHPIQPRNKVYTRKRPTDIKERIAIPSVKKEAINASVLSEMLHQERREEP